MAKPSIFSKNYRAKIKKIRRRRFFIAFLLILILGSCYKIFIFDGNFNFGGLSKSKDSINNKKIVNNDNKSKKSDSKGKVVPEEDETKTEEKNYTLTLRDGKEVKVIYEENNGEKKIKNVNSDIDNTNYKYSINPSSNGVVIFDIIAQNIIYVDINGNKLDITKQNYTSSNGQVYTKEEILKNNPSYVWDSTPTFIDNDNIAYVSQRPWFNGDDTKYIWIVNVKAPESHVLYENLNGKSIEFGNVNPKGLTTIIDGKTEYLNGNGNVSE